MYIVVLVVECLESEYCWVFMSCVHPVAILSAVAHLFSVECCCLCLTCTLAIIYS